MKGFPPALCDRCACWTRKPVGIDLILLDEDGFTSIRDRVRQQIFLDYGYEYLCPRCHGVVTKALEALKPRRRKNARGA